MEKCKFITIQLPPLPRPRLLQWKDFWEKVKKLSFISGGIDRELDYKDWTKVAQKLIKPENLILLSGSAEK